jgi:integrase
MPNEKGRRRRFGSVRQLCSGRYQARYQGPDGLPSTAPKTFDTEADALRWLTVTEAEVIRGDWFDWTAGEVPLREYAGKWIVERAGLAPRTVELYQSLLRLHIVPRLGDLDLVALTPGLVRSWRNDLLDRGVGRATVAKCYRLLRAVLNTAVDDELVRRNPCRIKGAGSEPAAERPVATAEQVLALAASMPARWSAFVLLGASTSLRWGELLALTRSDVDLDEGTVRVRRSASEVDGQVVMGPPKSEAGRRTVAIPASILPALQVHLDSYAEAGPRGRVFVGAKGATMRRGNFQTMWAKALKKAGLPRGFHFHDLRHTGNTWAAGSGANLRELMDRMGHSSMRAALIYLHANRGASKAIAAGIDRQLAEAAQQQDAKGTDDDDASGT